MKVKARVAIRMTKTPVPVKEHARVRLMLSPALLAECTVRGWPTKVPNRRSVLGVQDLDFKK